MTKRYYRSNLGWELDKLFDEHRDSLSDTMKKLGKFVKVICKFLEIKKVPRLEWCDSYRQEQCISRVAANPCGGACYQNNTIYLRNHYVTLDDVLHELFHHVNALNDGRAISKIMFGWYRWFYRENYDYRKQLNEALQG